VASARRESRWAGAHVWDVPAHLVPIEGARRGVLRITRDASVAETLHSGMAREAAIGFTADIIHLPAIAQAELPPNLVPGLVRIAWDGGSPDGRIPELLRVGACLDLAPSDGALDALVECSEGGVMCRLVDLAAWTTAPEALASSLEHYLTSPRLEAPIEPWHSIARGIASRRPRDLSGTYDETLRRNYWLGEDGSVSLSERHAAGGLVFGRLEDGPEGWQQSPAWRALEARRRQPFLRRSTCAFCPHYLWCGAYAADDAGSPDPAWCGVWIPLFERLQEAADIAWAEAGEGEPEEYPG